MAKIKLDDHCLELEQVSVILASPNFGGGPSGNTDVLLDILNVVTDMGGCHDLINTLLKELPEYRESNGWTPEWKVRRLLEAAQCVEFEIVGSPSVTSLGIHTEEEETTSPIDQK
tara:strand:+ start:189 stop:533 length:345 start_codon:yes stop_codon:yes gene_type:complete